MRKRHPFEGQALDLLGWMRRHGKLELLLALPDGSKSLIPAAWTDLEAGREPDTIYLETLGSIQDLLKQEPWLTR